MRDSDQSAERRVPKKRPVRAKITPVEPQPLTSNAGIFKIMGIGKSKKQGGYSWRKHEISI